MLWLALYFPAFPLEVFFRGASLPEPLVVAEKKGNRAWVAACNEAAEDGGVHTGMPVSAAQALVGGLTVCWRDPAAERESLAGLAAWAGRFTPSLSLQPPHGLLLEIGGCLRLHRGLDNLRRDLKEGLEALGYSAVYACAPTPHSAWLLAKAGKEACIRDSAELESALAPLPVQLLEQPEGVMDGLEMIGAHTVGECLRLPRAGLVRRFGRRLPDELDRALGKTPDARAFFIPPPRFKRHMELPAPVEAAEALLFATSRLLPELEGYLVLHQAGVQQLELQCRHEGVPDTVVSIGFVQPVRDRGRMQILLRETLGRTHLPAPVHAIVLKARRILPIAAASGDLFQEHSPKGDGNLLLERLRARLGKEAVHGLAPTADHRPELAWKSCDAGEGNPVSGNVHRPLWLLPSPTVCRDGRLVLKSGPERIESGWWDGRSVARDYYVAQDRNGARLWVYCDRNSGEWFVHGLFA